MTDQKTKRIAREGVIKAYQEGFSAKEIAEQYQLCKVTVYRWIRNYTESGRTENLKRGASSKKRRYIGKVLELYKSGMNYEQIHRQLPAVSRSSARRWIIESGTESSRGCVAMKAEVQKTKQPESKDSYTKEELLQMSREQMIQEILRMQARNHVRDARLLLAETMIDVAEEQFGIQIRKKPGAK